MAEDELWHPQDVLQTDSASRKLWLVKVRVPVVGTAAAPPFLHPRCRAGMASTRRSIHRPCWRTRRWHLTIYRAGQARNDAHKHPYLVERMICQRLDDTSRAVMHLGGDGVEDGSSRKGTGQRLLQHRQAGA